MPASPLRPAMRLSSFLLLLILVAGCGGPSLKQDRAPLEPSFASGPADSGPLAGMATDIRQMHGADVSGFRLLDSSHDGLKWRLALIDSAVSSVDIQTYLWYPDHSGRLMLDRAIRAADRGVRVRLIVDDLLTIGQEQLMVELQRHPMVELRLFNPWEDRGTLSRAGEMIAQMERLNTRMHDKLVIADSHAAVVGGRNIGDHYFGLSHDYNFHDLDALGFGPIAQQANAMFDSFWNSTWVVSAEAIDVEPDPEFARQRLTEIRQKIAEAPELEQFPRQPVDWQAELAQVAGELHFGQSRMVFDEATGDAVDQNVAKKIFSFMDLAQEELLITNAYIIPGQPAIDFIQSLTDRGVKVRILTNSLASHDVPAVNSHYQGWRDDFIRAGAELHELRADAAIQGPVVEVAPVSGEFTGLHTKAMVVDRQKVFIGSMNLDPRSFNINTEAGVFVDSPGLGEALARLMERDMGRDNAWQVLLDEEGEVYWVNDQERLDQQPARSGTQRVMDAIFKMFPKEQY